MLRPRCKVLVNMHRVLVHAQQAEEGVVKFGNGAAGPVTESLARLQVFKIPAVFAHLVSLSRLKKYAGHVCVAIGRGAKSGVPRSSFL